jgi:hypothetical protein
VSNFSIALGIVFIEAILLAILLILASERLRRRLTREGVLNKGPSKTNTLRGCADRMMKTHGDLVRYYDEHTQVTTAAPSGPSEGETLITDQLEKAIGAVRCAAALLAQQGERGCAVAQEFISGQESLVKVIQVVRPKAQKEERADGGEKVSEPAATPSEVDVEPISEADDTPPEGEVKPTQPKEDFETKAADAPPDPPLAKSALTDQPEEEEPGDT